MIGPLPHDLSRLSTGLRDRAVEARDKRLTLLIQRWPHRLTRAESRELKRLWEERMRLAKFSARAGHRRTYPARDGRDAGPAAPGISQGERLVRHGALARQLVVADVEPYEPASRGRTRRPELVIRPGDRAGPAA